MGTRTIILLEITMALIAVLVLRGSGYSDIELQNPHYAMNDEVPCLDCHDTYMDEVDEHEFILGVTEICNDCHDIRQLGRSHPYDVDVDESDMEDLVIPDELPLADGFMTCGSCHNPHAEYLVTFKRYEKQYAVAGMREDYYQSYYTRMPDPGKGWDRLCLSCHPKH